MSLTTCMKKIGEAMPVNADDRAAVFAAAASARQAGKQGDDAALAAIEQVLQPLRSQLADVDAQLAPPARTPVQQGAAERAARRLAQPNTSPTGEPIHVHGFIAAEGGLRRQEMADTGFDKNLQVGNRWLFAAEGKGLSIEQATEKLVQAGYLPEGAAHNEAYDLIRRSVRERPQYTPEGWERLAAAEKDSRFEDYLAAQAEDVDPLDGLEDLPALEEVRGEDAQVQREFAAIIAAAQAHGIDTESILEEAHYLTQNGDDHDFRSEAATLIESARQGDAGPALAPESGGQPAGQEGAEQGRAAAGREGPRAGDQVPGAARAEAALTGKRLPDGTLLVKGPTAQAERVLEGLTFQKTPSGTLVSRRHAEQAQQRLSQQPGAAAAQDLLGDVPNASQQAATGARAAAAQKERNGRDAAPDSTEFTLTGSDRAADEAAARGQGDLLAPAADKIDDLGEKIGGARKDTAESTGPRTSRESDGRPTWAKRFQISQIVRGPGQVNGPSEEGRWIIRDSRNVDWHKQPKQVGRSTFATKEEAEAFLPIAAVGMKHRVVLTSAEKYEIWRDVSDRKRVKVVDQQFDTREAAQEHMVHHATEILETNTTFGEADLPLPPDRRREGAPRRAGDVAGSDFMEAFGFRGVEFGNWNNQQERQALMNDAYDGLLDLADVMGVPPKALSLNGDLALAFGARGHGLNSARAHYELERAVINLTKERGAGSLAHEWFHALDHHFGRQDGKASSQWATAADGTRTLKVRGADQDMASGGFSSRSGVREELRKAYDAVIQTIAKKASAYVEDTAKADEFTGRAREDLARELDKLRQELSAQKDPKYWKRNNKPAASEQLVEFDAIARRMLDGEAQALETDWRTVEGKAKLAARWTNDALEQIGVIYKAVRGRSGFDASRSALLDNLRGYMSRYSQRLKMLADAQAGTEKVKMVPTEFAMNARELDQGRGTDYWTTPHEMAARAFQGFVEDKIAQGGGMSRFLNYAPENAGVITPWGVKFPYPRGAERTAINQALQSFVGTLKSRETDSGVELFKRGAAVAASGLDIAGARQIVNEVTRGWNNGPKVHVVATAAELPVAAPEDSRGLYRNGEVWVVASAHRAGPQARPAIMRTLAHEAVAHYGLRNMLGKDGWHQLMGNIQMALATGNKGLLATRDHVRRTYRNADGSYGLTPGLEADEIAARVVEDGVDETGQFRTGYSFLKATWARIARFLRDLGVDVQFTAAELHGMLMLAQRNLQVGARVGGGAQLVVAAARDGTDAQAARSSLRERATWHRVVQTQFGPEFEHGGLQLLPLGEKDTSTDLGENSLPLGHAAHVAPGNQVFDFAIARDGVLVGSATLEVGPDGQIAAVHDIDITDRRAGTGRAVMESVLASAAGPVRIIDIVPSAEGFWDKMGAGAHDVYANATADWESHQATRANARAEGHGAPDDADAAQVGDRQGAAAPEAEDLDVALARGEPRTIEVDGKRRPIENSKDQLIATGFREQQNFWRWFGDSKVVNRSTGAPLIMYHGTNKTAGGEAFTTFDTYGSNHGLMGMGSYFTAEPMMASEYTRKGRGDAPTVYPVYLSIKNALDMDAKADAEAWKRAFPDAETFHEGGDTNESWFRAAEDALRDEGVPMYEGAEAMQEGIRSMGYDGITHIGGGRIDKASDVRHRVYIAFDPEQIKSATGNNGGFDASNPDIAFARGAAANEAETTDLATPAPRMSRWRDATGRLQFAPGQALYELIGKAADPLLSKLQIKSASPAMRRALREMKVQVSKAQETAAAVAGEANKLTAAERAMVSDLIEKEVAAGIVPPEHAVRLATLINDVMGKQTDELVRLGMLEKDSADKWRGQYLPRFYESKLTKKAADAWADAMRRVVGRPRVMKGISGKHLRGRGLFETIPESQLPDYEAMGWEVRDPDFKPGQPTEDGTVQVWRDFTRAERDDMGEIRDAGFRFVMGYMQTQRDLALGQMFEALAEDPAISSRTPTEAFSIQVPTSTVQGTGAKTYGKLAGRWVSKDTLSHLSAIEEAQSEALQMYRKAMGWWKLGKTAMNPVSHVNNVLSNLTMAHFAGVSYWDAHKYLAAVHDLATHSPTVQEAKDAGLFLGTLSEAELQNMLPPELRQLAKQQEAKGAKIGRTVFDLMTFFLRRPMGWAYQAEDTFFRYLLFRDARSRGMEPSDAVDYAQRFIFTYDDLPKGARRIRDFAIPFFSYTYKAAPALLQTALTHPLRMAAPAAVLWAANAAAYAIAAGDDDDDWNERLRKYLTDPAFRAKAREQEQLEREHLPPWMKGTTALLTPKTLRLGMDEVTKLPLFIDMSRLIPGGDLFDVSPNAGGLPIPQPITPSHPLFTTAVAMIGNKDLFFGKELVDGNDTKGEAFNKRAQWLWTQLSPAISAGNYHWQRGMSALAQATGNEVTWMPDALGGDATGVGRDGLPVQPKYAAMQTFGIKVRPIDIDRSEAIDASMRRKMLRDIDAEMRSMKRLYGLDAVSERAYDKALESAQTKKERLRQGLTVDGDERR